MRNRIRGCHRRNTGRMKVFSRRRKDMRRKLMKTKNSNTKSKRANNKN